MRSRVTAVPLALGPSLFCVACRPVGVRRLEIQTVERSADVVSRGELIVQLGKGDVLLGGARESAELRRDEGVRGGARRGRNRRQAGLRPVERGAGVTDRVDLAQTLVGEEVEEFVLDDGPADAAAELLLLVNRLGVDAARFLQRVQRVQRGVPQVVEQIGVRRVGSGFRDGVDHAAGRLAQFRAVVAGGHLKLLHRIHAVDVAERGPALGFGEERLGVAGSIHGALVVQAGNAAIGDQAVAAVGGGVGGQQREALPTPSGDRQILLLRLRDHLRHLGLLGVDDGGVAGHGHRFGRTLHGEREVHRHGLPYLEGEAGAHRLGEACLRDGDLVGAGLEELRDEDSGVIGGQHALRLGSGILDGHGGGGNDGAARVCDGAGDGTGAGGLGGKTACKAGKKEKERQYRFLPWNTSHED